MKAMVPAPGSSGASRARFTRNSRWTLVSRLTFPQVKARRNDPGVDEARTPPNTFSVAPCRSRPMPSIESAPAAMPAARHATFSPAFAARADVRGGETAQAGALGEGGQRDKARVRDQVRVVKRHARFRERMQQSQLRGVLPDGYVEASDTPIIPVQRAPFLLFSQIARRILRWIKAKSTIASRPTEGLVGGTTLISGEIRQISQPTATLHPLDPIKTTTAIRQDRPRYGMRGERRRG